MKRGLLLLLIVSAMMLLLGCNPSIKRIDSIKYELAYNGEGFQVYIKETWTSGAGLNYISLDTQDDVNCSGSVGAVTSYLVLSAGGEMSLQEALTSELISGEDLYGMDLNYLHCEYEAVIFNDDEYRVYRVYEEYKILIRNLPDDYEYINSFNEIGGFYGRYYSIDQESFDRFIIESNTEFYDVIEAVNMRILEVEELEASIYGVTSIDIDVYDNYIDNMIAFISEEIIVIDEITYRPIFENDSYRIFRDIDHPGNSLSASWSDFVQLHAYEGIYYYMKDSFHQSYYVEYDGEYYRIKDAVYNKIVTLEELLEMNFQDLIGY